MPTTTPIPVITGPTASGKTAFALEMAALYPSIEIISADSRQVYIGMDIGTAKPNVAERSATPHHLLDIVTPNLNYTAGMFARDANLAIQSVLLRGKIPLVVGGSGFYIKALFDGLAAPAADPDIYATLERRMEEEGYDALYAELLRFDPQSAQAHAPNNRVKTLRALACYIQTGQRYSDFLAMPDMKSVYRPFYLALAQPRDVLYKRINRRVVEMVEEGLIGETEKLLMAGYHQHAPGMKTVGYTEALQYLAGNCDLEAMVAAIQQSTRRYAKRQLTWFRRSNIAWLESSAVDVALTLLRGEGIQV